MKGFFVALFVLVTMMLVTEAARRPAPLPTPLPKGDAATTIPAFAVTACLSIILFGYLS